MSHLQIILDLTQTPFRTGVKRDQVVHVQDGVGIGRMPGGMQSGKSSVALSAPLPDGKFLFLEMSMMNFLNAAQAFKSAEHVAQVKAAEGNPDAQALLEHNQKYERNTQYFGSGTDTGIILPCPFCAEPDFMRYKIIESQLAMMKGATCKVCGRACRTIFAEHAGSTAFEIVQTGGDDPPSFLPKMRRAQP